MLKILFSIIGVSAVLALKCHICDNYDTAKCRNIENSNNTFLKECKQNETKCASLESRRFLLLLCVIYCVAIVCSKKYYNDYEKETEECDQYYVKENKVDLKDETIQVESIKEKNND
ncbi:uncharacterized protein ACRADG_012948 isoform 3-T3 [Cochliomyia hominivorax]